MVSSNLNKASPKPAGKHNIRFSTLTKVILLSLATLVVVWTVDVKILHSSHEEKTPTPVSPNVNFMVQVLQKTGGKNICLPEGLIKGTTMDFEQVEAESRKISKVLNKLVKTDFFRKIKVDLRKECVFWKNEDFCYQKGCMVEELEQSSIPQKWYSKKSEISYLNPMFQQPSRTKKQEFSFRDFSIVNDESEDGVWLDLVENPEKFTGYAGPAANQIWLTIYQHNCFGVSPFIQDTASGWGDQQTGTDKSKSPFVYPPTYKEGLGTFLENLAEEQRGLTLIKNVPQELRLFYSTVSGLHASTSTHICYDHFDQKLNKWSPNLGCFIARIGSFPERLHNIYHNYVLVLRAIQKMSPYLKAYDYSIGDETKDKETKKLVNQLLRTISRVEQPFIEDCLFRSKHTNHLLEDFKTNFRNISRIMDCTGCEKCRLWGKTQVLGLGTSLKVLFSYSDKELNNPDLVDIKRNEIVALVATFNQFSQSLRNIEHFRNMYQDFLNHYKDEL
ncbi:hypothetical protein BB558_001040 [Smittium angustum]|nr:hypothetical protein BB558_001040 [Smittium angustum]